MKKQLNLDIDEELVRKAKSRAALEGITLSKIVTDCLKKYVEKKPKKE